MAKWILLTIGLLLLIPEGWYLIRNPIRPNDTSAAFRNLAEVPAWELRQKHIVSVSVTMPDDAVWRRIRRSWGDPAYEIALVSSLNERQYCFDGISVSAVERGRQQRLEQAGWMYGFGSDDSVPQQCQSAGQEFHAAPGSVVDVTLKAAQVGPGEMIVVRPVWDNTKDKLVGVGLDEDIRLILKWTLVVGLGVMVLSALMFVREKYLRTRSARRNVIA